MKSTHTIPVLMYHHVRPGGGMIATTPEHFAEHLEWLVRHGYTALSADEFARHLREGGAPRRSILITFDDGYLDNWVYAAPLLQRFGLKAVIFIVTQWIGQGGVRPRMGQGLRLPDSPDHRECEQRIQQGHSDDVMLRWSEIQAMRAEGLIEFHSHTHTHTRWDLSQPDDKNVRMKDELAQSRASLARHLGEASSHLCWPQGYFDPDYVQIAQQAGFRTLYTTQAFGRNRPGSDPLNVYRFAVRDTSGASVGRRVQVAAHPLVGPVFNRWKRWKRGLRA